MKAQAAQLKVETESEEEAISDISFPDFEITAAEFAWCPPDMA